VVARAGATFSVSYGGVAFQCRTSVEGNHGLFEITARAGRREGGPNSADFRDQSRSLPGDAKYNNPCVGLGSSQDGTTVAGVSRGFSRFSY